MGKTRTIVLNEELYQSIRCLFANDCTSGAIQAAIQDIQQNNINIDKYLIMSLKAKNNNKRITITLNPSLLDGVKINKGVYLRAVCYYLIHLY